MSARSCRSAWALILAMAAACGTPGAGPRPGETAFWHLTGSTVDFSACSDTPTFRNDLEPIDLGENTFLVYRVDKDGRQATVMDCPSVEPSSCKPSEPPFVFDVAGNELLYSTETKSPIGKGGCQVHSAQVWTAVDRGMALDLAISETLSLVDHPTDCPEVERQIKAQSPNGIGLEGCVITHSLEAELYQ